MSYNTETQKIREGLFRFGQAFSDRNIDFVYYRDPLAHFLCKVVVNDGMGKGFNVVAPGTDELLDWDSDLQEVLADHYKEFLQSIFFQRRDGSALHYFIKDDNKLVNFAGAKKDYKIIRDKTGEIISGEFNAKVKDFNGVNALKIEKDKDNYVVMITNRREMIGEGMSVLEPVWDLLFAIYMLVSHSAYFVAKTGAGQKRLGVPETVFTDQGNADILSSLVTAASEFGSAADTIIYPKTLDGIEVEFEVITVSSGIDFNRILDMYLSIFSAHTGIPQSTLKGLIPGQLTGAEVNEESYFDFLKELQDSHRVYLKWFVKKLGEHYGFESDQDFEILFTVRKVISEIEEMDLLNIKADIVNKLKSAGLKTIEAFKLAKLEMITESDLKEGVDEPIDFEQGDNIKSEDDKENIEETEDDRRS